MARTLATYFTVYFGFYEQNRLPPIKIHRQAIQLSIVPHIACKVPFVTTIAIIKKLRFHECFILTVIFSINHLIWTTVIKKIRKNTS